MFTLNDEATRALANAWRMDYGTLCDDVTVAIALRDAMANVPSIPVICDVADWCDEIRAAVFGG